MPIKMTLMEIKWANMMTRSRSRWPLAEHMHREQGLVATEEVAVEIIIEVDLVVTGEVLMTAEIDMVVTEVVIMTAEADMVEGVDLVAIEA